MGLSLQLQNLISCWPEGLLPMEIRHLYSMYNTKDWGQDRTMVMTSGMLVRTGQKILEEVASDKAASWYVFTHIRHHPRTLSLPCPSCSLSLLKLEASLHFCGISDPTPTPEAAQNWGQVVPQELGRVGVGWTQWKGHLDKQWGLWVGIPGQVVAAIRFLRLYML